MCALRPLALVLALVLAAPIAGASPSRSDAPLLARVRAQLPSVERAARAAGSGSPEAVQAHYEAARDLEEGVRAVAAVSADCRDLRREALAFARAHVTQAEGFDRRQPPLVNASRRRAAATKVRLERALVRCRNGTPGAPGRGPNGAPTVRVLSPRPGGISFGPMRLETLVPSGASWAVIAVGKGGPGCTASGARRIDVTATDRLRVDLPLRPGRHDIAVWFCAQTKGSSPRVVGTGTVNGVWVLPASARSAATGRSPDRALSNRLRGVAAGFDGYSAVWYHDLLKGRTAAWNADARFPAASTVKLAVLVAALRTLGPSPEQGRFGYDLKAMTGWSSNLATNRLLGRIGRGSAAAGSRAAEAVLKELGARSSTFTGEYRVGTSITRPRAEPPRVSSRVTTARDLGRILYLIHAGATGRKSALTALKLERRRAQLALGMLLASEPYADNVGLVRGSVARSVPVAQKNGWLADARHTAAIVYVTVGPQLAILLTYRPRLTLAEAAAYAGEVLQVVLDRGTRRP